MVSVCIFYFVKDDWKKLSIVRLNNELSNTPRVRKQSDYSDGGTGKGTWQDLRESFESIVNENWLWKEYK